MKPYAVCDLHCDTLTLETDGDSLNLPSSAFSLEKLPHDVHWAQCTAIFTPDKLALDRRIPFYERCKKSFDRQMKKYAHLVSPCRTAADVERAWSEGKHAALLTVENGCVLAGQMARAEVLARDGVRMIALTWNGVNEIGSGNVSTDGLTKFGKALIPEMEELGMIVDVSHLNDSGLHDVFKLAKKPFAASHSNCRAVCGHMRNLTDNQLREMFDRSCLVGLNFCVNFLKDGGEGVGPDDLLRHIDHMLELGGENSIALGSDFDGTILPDFLPDTDAEAGIADLLFSRGYSEALIEKLMYRNALDFWRANLPH